MSNSLILKYELKKVVWRPYVYFGIAIACAFAVGVATEVANQSSVFSLVHINSLFANVSEFIIIIYAAKAFGDEYQHKTSSVLFTGIASRMTIVALKLTVVMLISIMLAFISSSISIVSMTVISTEPVWMEALLLFGKVLVIYMTYSFCTGAYTILLTLLTRSTVTGIVASIGTFSVGKMIFDLIANKMPSSIVVVEIIPMYSASRAIQFLEYGIPEIAGMIGLGVICILITYQYLKKADIA